MKNYPENLINNGKDSLSSLTKKTVATAVIQDQIERYPGYPCEVGNLPIIFQGLPTLYRH